MAPQRFIHTAYKSELPSKTPGSVSRNPLKYIKRKWVFVIIPLFLITAISFVFHTALLSIDNTTGTERLSEVVSFKNLGAFQGGSTTQSFSTLFLRGTRNTSSLQVRSLGSFSGYGEGPTEPSLASALSGSLLKQSSPITIVASDNTRNDVTTYIVKPGDVPSIIAASFGITSNTLLWANNLSDGQYIQPGDELIILPVSGVRYKVKSGDTISGIAARYRGESDEIIIFNGLDIDGSIIEGEYVIIPDGEMPTKSYIKYVAKYAPHSENLDDYFIHPTAGIGYKSRGIHGSNAVDVAAPCWTPIYAAAEGTVAISDAYGWNGGYGKYIKIEHPNGTKTLYSHNIQNEVSAGQSVLQGQLIAYMGSTGRSTGCHVHWEVYNALNPLR